jgi:hypothetical protein
MIETTSTPKRRKIVTGLHGVTAQKTAFWDRNASGVWHKTQQKMWAIIWQIFFSPRYSLCPTAEVMLAMSFVIMCIAWILFVSECFMQFKTMYFNIWDEWRGKNKYFSTDNYEIQFGYLKRKIWRHYTAYHSVWPSSEHHEASRRTAVLSMISMTVPCWLPKLKLDIHLIWTIAKIYKTITSASYAPVLRCYKRNV